jgi:hypothetical protein
MSIPEKYLTVTTFKFPSLLIKVYCEITDKITLLDKQIELFNAMRAKINELVKQNDTINPNKFEAIIDGIKSVDNDKIKKIELLNPNSTNGFIFEF